MIHLKRGTITENSIAQIVLFENTVSIDANFFDALHKLMEKNSEKHPVVFRRIKGAGTQDVLIVFCLCAFLS